jgi:hypothetical protein
MHHTLLRCGAFTAVGALAAALASAPALASEWTELDLASADRVNAVLDADGLGAGPTHRELLGASLREEGETSSALAVFPAEPLDTLAGAVRMDVEAHSSADEHAAVLAEVRGRRDGGEWGEWREAAETGEQTVELAGPADEVQVRLSLGSNAEERGDRISAVRLRPADTRAPDSAPDSAERVEPAEPQSSRLFATRIGLVGGQTANGHIVRTDDYFAALPSRRGLASRGEGEYTVRVCTTARDGRCVYLPVWDVGPWNIQDDHWNADREMWLDLPKGKPQAQAAHLEGHNQGLDGFGRRVLNPAGIDLADGAFRQGLRLPTNAWVDVDYLWTGDDAHDARVATESRRDPVVLRSGPSTDDKDVGRAAHAARIDVHCAAEGQEIEGPIGKSEIWYRLGAGDHIPAAFVQGAGDVESCEEG